MAIHRSPRSRREGHPSFGATWPTLSSAEITGILVDGADAVVMGTIGNTVRSTGKGYRAHFALHITVENGLVTRYHVYEDSLSVAQAFAD